MPAGRPRKPAAVHIANGNPGHRPIRIEADFSKAKDLGTAPQWLDAGAKKEYKRVVTALSDLDMLRATDLGVVCSYAVNFSRWVAAEKVIAKEGTTITMTGSQGQQKMIKHPALAVAAEAQTLMLRAGALLGLNPVDRAKISATPKQLKNPFAALMGHDGEDQPAVN